MCGGSYVWCVFLTSSFGLEGSNSDYDFVIIFHFLSNAIK
jgi:hypothetical protein